MASANLRKILNTYLTLVSLVSQFEENKNLCQAPCRHVLPFQERDGDQPIPQLVLAQNVRESHAPHETRLKSKVTKRLYTQTHTFALKLAVLWKHQEQERCHQLGASGERRAVGWFAARTLPELAPWRDGVQNQSKISRVSLNHQRSQIRLTWPSCSKSRPRALRAICYLSSGRDTGKRWGREV